MNQFFEASIFLYISTFVISFLESLVVIGLIAPGTVFLLFVGFLLSKGFLNIPLIVFLAVLGAVLGDMVSFYLGKKGTNFFKKENKILKLANLEKGRGFFKKHGGKSIFLGRFTGPLRSLIPFIAGTFHMNYKSFLVWNIISGFLWAVLYLFLGFSLGEAWRVVETYSNKVEIFIAALIALLIFFYFLRLYFSSKQVKSIAKVIIFFKDLAEETIFKIDIIRKNSHFISDRFKKHTFFGLPFTFLIVVFLYILFLFFTFTRDAVLSGRIHGMDVRIENLLVSFRDDDLIRFFYWITLLANWQIILSMAVTLAIVFFLIKKRAYLYTLWTVVVGAQALDSLAKITYGRARPESALFVENSYSFPSGHSTMAVAFYGYLAYIFLRTREGKKKKINVIIAAFLLIFLIGFSRMYLGLHFLSDIIGGYLLGALWLIVAISIYEWTVYRHKFKVIPEFKLSKKNRNTVLSLILLELLLYVGFALNYQKNLNFKSVSSDKIITSNILLEYKKNNIPKFSETLGGEKQEPMSFLIIVKNESELINFFNKSGWLLADYFNRNSIYRMIIAGAFNQSYPTNVITPSFWNYKVHDFGFQKPTPKNIISERHHVRFWETNIFTKDGKRLFIGTASFDVGMKWVVSHSIDPNIDAEREFLFKDLLTSGMIRSYQKIQLVSPTKGKNFTGDAFYTDGKAYFIELK
jgi:membrane protein DedA with SNARE-associated domain